MKTSRILLLFLTLAFSLAAADAPKRCAACQRLLAGTFFWATSPALKEKQAVCEACRKLKTQCAICQLPIPDPRHALDDKRVLCDRDFAAGIFDEKEALRVFEEAKRDVHRMLRNYGVLPDDNITVSLVNGKMLAQLYQSLPSVHDSGLLGLTKTEMASPGRQFRHSIYLINGLGRARLAATAAHEFTHAWMHENIPETRKLEKDTIEGFCELVAFKLMSERRDEVEKKVILANAYTRGQVNAFVQAENEMQFSRVINWLKTGVDEQLAEANPRQVLAVKNEPPPIVWPPPSALVTAVPGTLLLKGISGTPARRFALINDATLAKNEEARVRVGSSNVVLRCLEIRPRSVLVQLRGGTGPFELVLTGTD